MNQENYIVTNLEGYVTAMRECAANEISDHSDQDNLDDYISINQMINLVHSHSLGFDNNRPILNEEANTKIFEDTILWINNAGLAKLASQDLIECAWDNKQNTMIFWSKEDKKNGKRKNKRNKR